MTTSYDPTPNLLAGGASRVCAGRNFSCAVDEGVVRCWGLGNVGQLGNGDDLSTHQAVTVSGLSSTDDLTCGLAHACAIEDSAIRCWGAMNDGTGGAVLSNIPVAIQGLPPMTQVSAGTGHTCGTSDVGDVWCWGANDEGQLGTGDTIGSPTPAKVEGLPSAATQVTASRAHTCAVTADARLFCWGGNEFGQLGDGTIDASMTPVEVTLP